MNKFFLFFIKRRYQFLVSALCACVEVGGQRRGGRRQQPRRGRQGAPGVYDAPAPVYAASDAAPVYEAADAALSGYEAGGDDALAALQGSIPGIPGEDYPIYAEVPETAFLCDGQVDGGYYADPEAECQAFHICSADGQGGLAKYSFLCPNGTIFNQNYFICDWWFNFDCSEAEGLYSLNDEIAAEREAASGDQSAYGAPVADYSAGGAAATYEAAERAGRRLGNRRNNRRGGQRSGRRGFRG